MLFLLASISFFFPSDIYIKQTTYITRKSRKKPKRQKLQAKAHKRATYKHKGKVQKNSSQTTPDEKHVNNTCTQWKGRRDTRRTSKHRLHASTDQSFTPENRLDGVNRHRLHHHANRHRNCTGHLRK